MKFLEKAELQRQKAGQWLPRQGVGMGTDYKWAKINFVDDGNVLKQDCDDVAQIHKFTKICQTVH